VASGEVLLVGAYERDNFGDLLFLLITEHYLERAGVTLRAASPLAADMRALLGRHIPAYVTSLSHEEFGAVWTVGGEVGGVHPDLALQMSLSAEQWERYVAQDAEERQASARMFFGGSIPESAYLPRLSGFPRNAASASIINSVGLAHLLDRDQRGQASEVRILREADAISVRDKASSDLLVAHGIEHSLAPDLIHTLRINRPGARDTALQAAKIALIQMSERVILDAGLEGVAISLAGVTALASHSLRFFAAGTAAGHDSIALYDELAARIRTLSPGRDVDVIRTRDPLELADTIARASLWVGGSLHGRIISCAYDVPRVSLANPKVDRYAELWDPEMPFGVSVTDLDDAVLRATDGRTQRAAAGTGQRLAELAEANIDAIIRSMFDATAEERLRRRQDAARPLSTAKPDSALRSARTCALPATAC
jgi:polysaccharide pyruvyl transferase WcaK-like protein